MTHPELWMRRADCRHRPDLPWVRDPAKVGLGEEASMGVVCSRCPVEQDCAAYVERAGVSSGFWAGDSRDPPAEAVGGVA